MKSTFLSALAVLSVYCTLAQEFTSPDGIKPVLQKVVVSSLIDEVGFVENGKLDTSNVSVDDLLTRYEKAKSIDNSSDNRLRGYFADLDTIFNGAKNRPESLTRYCAGLLDKLDTEKRVDGYVDSLSIIFRSVSEGYSPKIQVEMAEEVAPVEPVGPSRGSSEKTDSLWIWITIGVIAVLALLSLILVFRIAKMGQEESQKRRDLKSKVSSMEQEIGKLKIQLKGLDSSLDSVKSETEKQSGELDKLAKEKQARPASPKGQPEIKPATEPVAPTPPPAPKKKYAMYADQGNGFSVSNLADSPTGETIFEIILTSDTTAEFVVREDPAVQDMVKSDIRMYLGDTCEYTNPSSSAFIRTTKKGRLRLQGNLWLIEEKAAVRFEQ